MQRTRVTRQWGDTTRGRCEQIRLTQKYGPAWSEASEAPERLIVEKAARGHGREVRVRQ